ncbi:MAG: hypothetical protein ABSG98_11275 [Anaerolineales bacterium]|jgi:hypothetical protein
MALNKWPKLAGRIRSPVSEKYLKRIEALLAALQEPGRREVEAPGIALDWAKTPPAFWDDLSTLLYPEEKEQYATALYRMASAYFTQGAVFHDRRWALLEPLFLDRLEGQKSSWRARLLGEMEEPKPEPTWESVYTQMSTSALSMAIRDLGELSSIPARTVYPELRLRVRELIEQDLNGGQTTDRLCKRRPGDASVKRLEPYPEEEATEEAMLRDAQVLSQTPLQDVESAVDEMLLRRELGKLTRNLTPEDWELFGDKTDKELAQVWGVTPAAVRKRRERLRERLSKELRNQAG